MRQRTAQRDKLQCISIKSLRKKMRAKASCSHFITESTSCKKLRGSLHKTQIARTLDFRAQTDSVLLDERLAFFQLAHFACQLCKFIFPSAPQVKIIFRSFIEIKASRTWHALRDGQAPAKYQTYHAATYATESDINVLALIIFVASHRPHHVQV